METALKIATSNLVKIDKGVPLPETTVGRRAKYPFMQMEVGDSFLVPESLPRPSGYRLGVEGNMTAKRNGKPWKFTVRKTDSGLRCWRVE